MKTITTSIEIAAPAAVVWDVLTDTNAFPRWNPFVTRLEGRLEVGERLLVRISPPGGAAMTFRPRVTAVARERHLAWLGSLGVPWLFDGAHSFTIEPRPDGTCLFTHAETFRGLLVPLLADGLRQTEAGFLLLNEALRERAEALALT